MLERLTHLRNVLDRLELHLEAKEDDTAQQLLCAVKALGREVTEAEVGLDDAASARGLLERGVALVERVKAYAEQNVEPWFHVRTPAPSDDDTIVGSTAGLYAMSHGMTAGATTPPEDVAEIARESQMIGRYTTTIPAPPPEAATGPTTVPEPDEVEPTK